jgi:hypothetical protein
MRFKHFQQSSDGRDTFHQALHGANRADARVIGKSAVTQRLRCARKLMLLDLILLKEQSEFLTLSQGCPGV